MANKSLQLTAQNAAAFWVPSALRAPAATELWRYAPVYGSRIKKIALILLKLCRLVYRLNERLVAIVEKALDLGYIEAWFKWIGWTLVSSAIFALGLASNSIWLKLAGLGSYVVVFLLVQVGLGRLQKAFVEGQKNKLGFWSLLLLTILGSLASVIFAMKLVSAIFSAQLLTNA